MMKTRNNVGHPHTVVELADNLLTGTPKRASTSHVALCRQSHTFLQVDDTRVQEEGFPLSFECLQSAHDEQHIYMYIHIYIHC